MESAQNHILCGQFVDFARAGMVVEELRLLGLADDGIEQFALNAPGQHDRYPIGGDEVADRQARGGERGAVAGAAVGGLSGLAVGTAAIPVAGPLAAAAGLAVGAYTGALAGAVGAMGDDAPSAAVLPPRPAGVRVVVHTPTSLHRTRALEVFARHHARSVEEARGTWRNGSWVDFDPVSAPTWIVPQQH